MTQKIRLDLIATSNLVMTPQLQQAIKLLQYNGEQLTEFLLKEVEKNPLLELASDNPTPDATNTNRPDNATTRDATELRHQANQESNSATNTAERVQSNLQDSARNNIIDGDGNHPAPTKTTDQQGNQEFYQADNSMKGAGSFGGEGEEDYLSRVAGRESLQSHLMTQIDLAFINDTLDHKIAVFLLGLVEETGWLTHHWQRDIESLGMPAATIERVLKTLQAFEPAGVFCRNLRECLTIQLADKDLLTRDMIKLLNNLDCFLSGDEKKLLERTGLNPEQIKPLIATIRAQDPKPGLTYQFQPPLAIEPDVVVFKNNLGEWQVELNGRATPRAFLNEKNYQRFLQSPTLQKKDKKFLAEKFYAAKWLIKSLQQRQETILKVASKIVEKQKNFFDHGIENLKPLILRDISTAIEMHESTVSRVTTNKYMATPRGMFEMKFFFTQALEGSDKDNPVSAEVVRHCIKNIIERETPCKILSDDVIVDYLKEMGFQVARRTVAKYRESLSIPSSVTRRKMKNNFLYLG
ncbi:MAG: RNA polymerase factor sigma-54 [Hydrotalea sp.]|nr:RNA polymerase factor sigma-54 [Hydrotalea sp.]